MQSIYLILQPNPLQSSSREVASFPLRSVPARWLWQLHLFAASPFSSSPPPSSSWTSPWSCRRWRTRFRRAPVRGCWRRGTPGCRSSSRRYCCRCRLRSCEVYRVRAVAPCFLGVMFINRRSPGVRKQVIYSMKAVVPEFLINKSNWKLKASRCQTKTKAARLMLTLRANARFAEAFYRRTNSTWSANSCGRWIQV